MNKQNKLYFPIFYKYSEFFGALPREELGELIHAIITSEGAHTPKEPLDKRLELFYRLLVDEARSIFDKACKGHNSAAPRVRNEPKERYGDFDPNEAFEKALRRSYTES